MHLMAGYQSKDSASFQLIALFDYLIQRTYDAGASISNGVEKN
jgi:hypothetical protein